MKSLFRAAILALLAFTVLPGSARAGVNGTTNYGIHYYYNRLIARPTLHRSRAATTTLPTYNLTFHGGPIQPATGSYTIFWQPSGAFMSPAYKKLINRFLSDVGGSPIYGTATTYYGVNGRVRNESRFLSTWTDRTPYPSGGIDDNALQQEILKAMKTNGWFGGLYSQFFIFTAQNAITSVPYCAYHNFFQNQEQGRPAIYAFIPYVGDVNGCDPPYGLSPNNDVAADGTIISVSHEQMEMVTDPLLNAWRDDVNGVENGDICIDSFGAPYLPSGGNLDLNGHDYFVQEEYSQARGACLPNL